jgi:serine/threonine-protein kinase
MDQKTIGPYCIVRVLGEGAMGMVLEARHQLLDRRVAIKILHPHMARDASICRRFINEALAVNRCRHRGIVDISDHGVLDNGSPYLVMEYIEGETVNQALDRSDGTLSLEAALRIGHEAAEALSAAHAKGIVHRDLKPDKITPVEKAL